MAEAPESSYAKGLNIEEGNSPENEETNKGASLPRPWLSRYEWWIQMVIYSIFVLGGQTAGTLLGRVYFDKGGNSKWMATFVQVAGFPVVFPFQWITTKGTDKESNRNQNRRFDTTLALVYISFGIFVAGNCMLYTIGLQYLPVTTYTLICASQLGFNAFFSYFLNAQRITPYIINSIVLLTISSVLLVFQTDPGDSNKSSKAKYVIGFICTVAASAGYALMLSVTQLAFKKIIKKNTLRAIIDMSIYQNLVATIVVVIGLFASGEWKKLNNEMERFTTGKVSYIMNLFWTAVLWQVFSVGCIGLIFRISSLFSNVISILGLPLAPILAVVFLHDTLTGLKAMSMVLAVWGFVSYTYQHYLDDLKTKEEKLKSKSSNVVSEISLTEGG